MVGRLNLVLKVACLVLFAAVALMPERGLSFYSQDAEDYCTTSPAGTYPEKTNVTGLYPWFAPLGAYQAWYCCSYVQISDPTQGSSAGCSPFGPGLNPTGTAGGGPSGPPPPPCEDGSIIYPSTQAVGEKIPITGAPFEMVYFSDKTFGFKDLFTAEIPVYPGGTPPTYIDNYDIDITLAGRNFDDHPYPTSNMYHTFVWDGLDNSSARVWGARTAAIEITETWDNTVSGDDNPVTFELTIGTFDARLLGLGGWVPSIFHFYDAVAKKILFGDGTSMPIPEGPSNPSEIVVRERGQAYTFDAAGRITSIKAHRTGEVLYTFTYDGHGHLISIEDAFSNETTFDRNGSDEFESITAPYGQVTAVTLDSDDLLETVTNPHSDVYTMSYHSSAGLIATFEKPEGQVTTFTYDGQGRLTEDSHASGYEVDLSRSATNPVTIETTTTSAEGRERIYDRYFNYDSKYQIDQATEPYGGTTSVTTYLGASAGVYRTDQYGNYETMSYANDTRTGQLRQSGYSMLTQGGKLRATTDTESTSSLVSLYNYGNIVRTQSINSKNTVSTFNLSTKTETTVTPESRTWSVEYDQYERPITFSRGGFHDITYSYDVNGRPYQITQDNRTTTMLYNADGFLLSVENPKGETTSYTYDTAGRLASTTLPGSRVIGYDYDDNGNVTSISTPTSQTHSFSFTPFETLYQYLPPSLGGGTWSTTYAYNNDKQVTLITRPDSQTATYDYGATTGLLDSVTTPAGDYEFTYRSNTDLVSQSTSPDGVIIDHSYDGNRLKEEVYSGAVSGEVEFLFNNELNYNWIGTFGSGSTAFDWVSFGYDNDLLLTSAGAESLSYHATTGVLSGATLDDLTDTYTYSNFAEVSQYKVLTSAPATLYQVDYTRDKLGRIESKTENVNGTTTTYDYTYDNVGRLVDVDKNSSGWRAYVYNDNGSRTSVTRGVTTVSATFDNQDRISTQGTMSFSHNSNGERTSMSDSSNSQTTSYTYDVYGHLKTVTLPNSTVIEYLLDAKNRRVGKLVSSTLTKQYLYQDQLKVVAELNSSGVLTKRFVYGSKSNVPDFMITSGGRFKIITNEVGSVILVVDASDGSVSQQIEYDDFGRVLSDSNPGFQPFGFAGGLYDPDTKLVHFGERDYDPETGRWLNKDPIRFAGGDTNLYGYVLNDPINLIDPSGLLGEFRDQAPPSINLPTPNPNPPPQVPPAPKRPPSENRPPFNIKEYMNPGGGVRGRCPGGGGGGGGASSVST